MPLVTVASIKVVTANRVAPIYRFDANTSSDEPIATIRSLGSLPIENSYPRRTITTSNSDTSNFISNINGYTIYYGTTSISTGYTSSSFSVKNYADNFNPLSLLKISTHTTGAAVQDFYSATNWSAAATGTKAGVNGLAMTAATGGGAQINTTRIITLPRNYTLFYAWYPNETDTYDRTLHRSTYEILAKMEAGASGRVGSWSTAIGGGSSQYTPFRMSKKWQTLIVVGSGPSPTSRLGTQQFFVDGVYVGQNNIVGSSVNLNTLGSSTSGYMNPPGHIREAGILGQALTYSQVISLHLRLTYSFNSNINAVSGRFYQSPEPAIIFGGNSNVNVYVTSSQITNVNTTTANKLVKSNVTYKKTQIVSSQPKYITLYPLSTITIVINGFSPIVPSSTPGAPATPNRKQYWF